MKINKLLESKKLKEGITRIEPALHFQGKSSHTFTKDKKWEVDFDEAGNILARTRHGKPSYFKGHINDETNDFPSTDEDNIILAAREQHGLKFGNKEVKEDYSHFEFTSGSNPYIAKTKAEVDRIKRSRGDSVKYVGNINGIDYYKVDDSEKDLFRVDDLDEGSIPRNALKIRATDRMNKKSIDLYKHNKYWKDSEGEDYNLYDPAYLRKWNDIEVLETDPNYKPNRTKPEYVVQGNYGYGWEDLTASDNQAEARNDLKAYRENETGVPHRLITRRVPVTENLKEAFKPSDSGIQSVKCYNRYNYTIQELRVDNDNKTFERGNFTAGKADKKVKNRQEYEDIVDSLKELGYTEIKSGYNSMRNKSRKGNPTSVEEGYELSPRIDYNPNHLRDDEGKIMADKWYGSKWPDDEVGIEQLKGITLDDALKDRKILDHCDTQVRERVYAQLDKYIPLSVDSPMYKEKNESKSIDEAHYGGAFDIADDQYFTREDLDSFAEEVLNHINETFKTQFDVSACYIDDGMLELEVTNDEYGDYIHSEKIDMRKIKEPWHLKRAYAFEFASQLINDITQSNDGLIESVSSSSHEFDDDVDDLSYYYDDETFKDNLENSPYTEIASKSVTDSDGFITDYTMYMNINTGEYVFVFGDKDVYSPEDGYFDWECDTKEEAEEWFNSYNGFDDVDDDIDWLGEDVEKSPIVHKKSDGSYMVANENGDGYVAYNKDDECVGNITANNENEAKNKFNSNQFDE